MELARISDPECRPGSLVRSERWIAIFFRL